MIDVFVSPAPDRTDLDALSKAVANSFPHSHEYINEILLRGSEVSRLHSLSALLLLSHGLKQMKINTDNVILARTASGKPYLADSNIFFSISHDRQGVAVAISDVNVGIDIQSPSGVDTRKISKRFFEKQESSPVNGDGFFMTWTKKEALCKLLDVPLSQILGSQPPANVFFYTFDYDDATVSVASMTQEKPRVHTATAAQLFDLCQIS